MGLTVGFVSGIIATVVFVVQLFIPFAIGLVLIGLIAPENSIVSWSVVSRLLHSTYWPAVLGSDTTATAGVNRRVEFVVWFQLIALLLVALASIITPLGLYEEIGPQASKTAIPFQYAPDVSTFGRASSPRDGYRAIRPCYTPDNAEFEHWCPNAPDNFANLTDIAEAFTVWPGSISLFTSGETTETVSSIFDMQWRSYRRAGHLEDVEGDDTPYSQGYYRPISQFVQDEDLKAVDGLIVDTKEGRLGFRNHTVPMDVENGAEWTEDILFIEPEVSCVDLNYTIDYSYNGGADGNATKITSNTVIVDQGGFADLTHTMPDLDKTNFQDEPSLHDRAFRAAWMNNMLYMQLWNVTTNGSDGSEPFAYMNSHKGKKFELTKTPYMVQPGLLQTSNFHTLFTSLQNLPIDDSEFDPSSSYLLGIGEKACGYPTGEELSNISAVTASCGIVIPPAQRADGGSSLFPEDSNSTWQTPAYSCAASAKAVIREVNFQHNGTGELGRLVVQSINAKQYPSSSDLPLWGVEKLDNATIGLNLPLWGLVSRDVAERPDISTVQREHLWLPGYEKFSSSSDSEIRLPGSTFFTSALTRLFEIEEDENSPYTSLNDAALFTRWLELSTSSSGVEKMLKLIWTDLSANSVVGTRSWLSSASSSTSSSGMSKRDDIPTTVKVPVTLWTRNIKYHIPYAIPAILAALFILTLGGFTLLLLVTRKTGIAKMRLYLAQTSAGRILAHFMYPRESTMHSPTKQWTQEVGRRNVVLPGTDAGRTTAITTAYRGNGYHQLSPPIDKGAAKQGETGFELHRRE